MLRAIKLQNRAGLTVSCVTIRYLPEMLLFAFKVVVFSSLHRISA